MSELLFPDGQITDVLYIYQSLGALLKLLGDATICNKQKLCLSCPVNSKSVTAREMCLLWFDTFGRKKM